MFYNIFTKTYIKHIYYLTESHLLGKSLMPSRYEIILIDCKKSFKSTHLTGTKPFRLAVVFKLLTASSKPSLV